MSKTLLKVDAERYDFCRERMLAIQRKYRFSFFYSLSVFTLIAILSVFKFRFELVSSVAAVFDAADGLISGLLGGFIQFFTCLIFIAASYLTWTYFHKLNIAFMLLYLIILILSIKDRNWLSLIIFLPGIFFYGISSSAMLEERELSQEVGYPNFRIPVDQLMESKKLAELKPDLRSDYDDFFTGKTDIPTRENKRED